MKKRIFIIILCIGILLSSIYLASVFTKEEIKVSDLASRADYVILASTYKTRCVYGKKPEEIKQIKSYEKDGKYYTEVYVDCPVKEIIGEIITIVNDENYFEEDGSFVLFINKLENEENTYTTLNGKSGIIRFEKGKAKPLDKSLKLDTVDLLWDWAYLNSQEKQQEILTSDGIYYFTYSTNIYKTTETTSAP